MGWGRSRDWEPLPAGRPAPAGLYPAQQSQDDEGAESGDPDTTFGCGPELVIDLRYKGLHRDTQVWSLLRKRVRLPEWFGNNLDAWNDTLNNGGISEELDEAWHVRIYVFAEGIFAPTSRWAKDFEEICCDARRAELVRLVPPG